MELPIHSVTSKRDGKAYVCFKVPPLDLEGSSEPIYPHSEYVTVCYPSEVLPILLELQKLEKVRTS